MRNVRSDADLAREMEAVPDQKLAMQTVFNGSLTVLIDQPALVKSRLLQAGGEVRPAYRLKFKKDSKQP